ncbi:MAG: metal-dependent hydrolase [Candidatus Paceibacterota bacterium]|jgi:inner membrane protein
MASAFFHIAVPAVLYAVFKSHTVNFKLFQVAVMCPVIPDADVIAPFKFGIPYDSQWGHRGFTHSISAALHVMINCDRTSVKNYYGKI